MKPIQIISQDLFDKIRSRFQNLEMGNETGAVTIDPAEARFFDFDFVSEDVNLGRVSISLNDLGSLKIYYSQGITENQDDAATRMWFNFLKEMRFFSMRRLLRFDTRDIAKSNLNRNDFQYLATKRPKEEQPMNMNESRWSQKSSRKTSRAVKGQTEVIMRHSRPVEETYPGARSQKNNIKAIFIQNKQGERFKYPFIHPAGAFAMAQHVDHGGVPHDPAGKAIVRMSEQIAQLQEFQRQIRPASLHDDAMGISERAIAKLHELKSRIAGLNKRQNYESWIAEFEETEDSVLSELDDVTMETYKQKFTQSSFNEHLAGLFPLIHSIMQETNKVDLEEYVGEIAPAQESATTESTDAFSQFEEWAEATEQGKLTSDQVNGLKQELGSLPTGDAGIPQLQLGDGGNDALEFLSQFGLDDPDLASKLQMAYELDPSTNAIEVLAVWAQENYPELNVALGMSGTEAPEEPAPEEPATQEENNNMSTPPEAMPTRENIVSEVVKIVDSFYNRHNESVGPFRAPENIALSCKKQVAGKFGERAGEFAEELATNFIAKRTQEWEKQHGQEDNSELTRLKELVGNIKSKVDEMSPTADLAEMEQGEADPGYIRYEQMKNKIADVLIKLYDQGKDADAIQQMGDRVAKHLGYDPQDAAYQKAWSTSVKDANSDNNEDDYTDYDMRQTEDQGVAEGSEWETRHDEFVTIGDRATPEQINKIVSALGVAAKQASSKRGFINQIIGKQSNGDLARMAYIAETLAKKIQKSSNAKPGTDERKELGQHLVYAVSLLKRMSGEQDVAEGDNIGGERYDKIADLKGRTVDQLNKLIQKLEGTLAKYPDHTQASEYLGLAKMIRAEKIGKKGVAEELSSILKLAGLNK